MTDAVIFTDVVKRYGTITALDRLTTALESLGPDAQKIKPMFVDVSMERPDPKGVATFVGAASIAAAMMTTAFFSRISEAGVLELDSARSRARFARM